MKIAGKIALKIAAHKYLTYLFICCCAALCLIAIFTVKFSKNIFDVLPFSDEVLNWHQYAAEKFGRANCICFGIESKVKVESIVSELVQEIEKNGGIIEGRIKSEDYSIDNLKKIFAISPYLFTKEDFDILESRISEENIETTVREIRRKSTDSFYNPLLDFLNPAGILSIPFERYKGEFDKGRDFKNGVIYADDERKAFFSAKFDVISSDTDASSELVRKIEFIVSEIEKSFPHSKIYFAGGYRVSADNSKIASADAKICLLATVSIVLLLCLLFFKRLSHAFFAIIPSALGALLAFAFTGLIFGEVSAISLAFASIATGVGMDYAIHAIFRIERNKGNSPYEIAKIANLLARPIATVSGTTIIAFLVMILFGESGFVQIGVFGSIAIGIAALISIFVLCGLLSGKRKISLGDTVFDRTCNRLYKIICIHKNTLFIITTLVALIAIPFALSVEFDGKIASLSALSDNAKNDALILKKDWNNLLTKNFAIVKGATLDEAIKESERIEKELRGKITFKKTPIMSHQKMQDNLQCWSRFWNNKKVSKFLNNLEESSRENKINFKAFDFAVITIKNPTQPNKDFFKNSGLSGLFESYVYVGDGDAAVLREIEHDSKGNENIIANISDKSSYIGTEYLGRHIAKSTLNWLWKFAAISSILAVIYLRICTAKWANTAIVIFPVILGLIIAFAIMDILGIPINIANVIFVIFSVCIAQDYAAFMLLDREDGYAFPAIMLSAMTTITAFGTLAFARHPLLYSLGIASALSVSSIFLCTLFTIPFMLSLGKGNDSSGHNKYKWRGKSYGGKFGNSCFYILLKIGMWPAYLLLIFVSAFFVIFRKKACTGGKIYLSRFFGRKVGRIEIYKLIYSFGICLLDKAAYMQGVKKIICDDKKARQKADKLMANNRGLVFLTAHIGGWEIAGTKLAEYGRETAFLGTLTESKEISDILDKSRKLPKIKMTGTPDDPLGIIQAFNVLRKGGIVAVQGDRYAGGRSAKVKFLGKNATFPLSPFVLSKLSDAAILPVVSIRKSLFKYEMIVGSPFMPKSSKSPQECAKDFAKFLEDILKSHPYQWFNFYDFWSD